jgi:hypothetical protein
MNERIKELAEQAMWHTNSKTGEVYRTHFQFEEKFAELIVKECIAQAELEEDRFTGLDAMDLAHAMQNFQNLLKQHFGVE